MGVLRKSGSTRISLPGLETPGAPSDEFLDAVREVAAGEQFEILGEMGQGKDLSIVYLARDLEERRLVALRLEPGAGDEYVLEVVQQLDSSIPSVEGDCPRCGAPPRGWGRFCTRCGVDLSGVASANMSKAELLEAAKEAAGGEFEILGVMSRAQGGGLVYFARQIGSEKLVALRLERQGEHEYSLGQTGILKSFAASLGAKRGRQVPPAVAVAAGSRPPPRQPRPVPGGVQPGASAAPPASPHSWDPVIDVLRQPLFLGGLLVAAILILAIVVIVLLP